MCNPDIEVRTVCMVHGRKPERIMSIHMHTLVCVPNFSQYI